MPCHPAVYVLESIESLMASELILDRKIGAAPTISGNATNHRHYVSSTTNGVIVYGIF